jgi:hypothetical protein
MKLRMWVLGWVLAAATSGAAEFSAGVARCNVTPPLPFRLSGYAARTNPATAVRSELWAKALALDDGASGRVVVVTADLIGFPREMTDDIAARAGRAHGLRRDQILFNASHTHYGPVVWPNLAAMYSFGEAERGRVVAYGRKVADDIVALVGAALADLAPARLDCGVGEAGFAINRREPSAAGIRLGTNSAGPVDRRAPVLRVTHPDGRLRAVLFGYACHGTTMPAGFNEVDSDFGGFAQRAIEKAHPGATAHYLILCGADQNPNPRGEVAHMERHGAELAAAVERALAGPLAAVRPPVRTAHEVVQLDFAAHTRETFEKEAALAGTDGTSRHKRRRAARMLEAYDAGKPVRRLPFQVHAVRFGADLTLLGLSGEVVVDYAIRARREFPGENLTVAGYCNDVSCYIPSLRVLREGGYEPDSSMIYYGLPGPFAEDVEETAFAAIRRVMARAGVSAAQ